MFLCEATVGEHIPFLIHHTTPFTGHPLSSSTPLKKSKKRNQKLWVTEMCYLKGYKTKESSELHLNFKCFYAKPTIRWGKQMPFLIHHNTPYTEHPFSLVHEVYSNLANNFNIVIFKTINFNIKELNCN